jgi:hypothetical protein
LPVVRQLLRGTLSVASVIHLQCESSPWLDVSLYLSQTKDLFRRYCMEILNNPAQHTSDARYSLKPEDEVFLNNLREGAERADWTLIKQIERLATEIDEYAPSVAVEG